MLPLTPSSRRRPWGSPASIGRALGADPDSRVLAEAWFGAHPMAPGVVETPGGALTLADWIAADPDSALGADVVARFGPRLPLVVKLLVADSPMPMVVHPGAERAAAGYAAEEALGLAPQAPGRAFPDPVHRPELVYAVGAVEAVCGFRAPRRAAELLAGLAAPLAVRLRALLVADPTWRGMAAAFAALVDPATAPDADAVSAVVRACTERLWDGSPSPRADRTAVVLGEEYPGDPGAVVSLLLNPVSLRAGEALYVPPGTVHAFLSGTAVAVSAASADELVVGLGDGRVDGAGALAAVEPVAAPPIRIAPELFHGSTRVFYAPVEDFELSVTTLDEGSGCPLPGHGPRVLLCLDGLVVVTGRSTLTLGRGQAAFVPAGDGPLVVGGSGTLVQAAVP